MSSRPEESWAVDPPKGMKNVCPATTPPPEELPFPLSSRPELRRSVVERSAVAQEAGTTELLTVPAETYQADSVKSGFPGAFWRRATESNDAGVLRLKVKVQLQIVPNQRRSSARLQEFLRRRT